MGKQEHLMEIKISGLLVPLYNLTTGIWIGYDDNKESELSSGNAAYLWKKFISEIYKIPIKK